MLGPRDALLRTVAQVDGQNALGHEKAEQQGIGGFVQAVVHNAVQADRTEADAHPEYVEPRPGGELLKMARDVPKKRHDGSHKGDRSEPSAFSQELGPVVVGMQPAVGEGGALDEGVGVAEGSEADAGEGGFKVEPQGIGGGDGAVVAHGIVEDDRQLGQTLEYIFAGQPEHGDNHHGAHAEDGDTGRGAHAAPATDNDGGAGESDRETEHAAARGGGAGGPADQHDGKGGQSDTAGAAA